MQEEIKMEKSNDKSTWTSLLLYILISSIVLLIKVFYLDTGVGLELGSQTKIKALATILIALITVLPGIIGGIFGVAIQYAITKFLAQKISKEQYVYQYEIWDALLYSLIISLIWYLLVAYFQFQNDLILSFINSVLVIISFFFIYFSGQEKKTHIKKAIVISQPISVIVTLGGPLIEIGIIVGAIWIVYKLYSLISS